jgi:hypothetical protein
MSTHQVPTIVSVERIDESSLIVEFSDGTFAEYTTAQLLAISPIRERAEDGGQPS